MTETMAASALAVAALAASTAAAQFGPSSTAVGSCGCCGPTAMGVAMKEAVIEGIRPSRPQIEAT